MRLLEASNVPVERIEEFLLTADQISKESLLEDGFVVEIGGQMKGCFVLETIEEDAFWLKQLYVTNEAAKSLPILVEAIIALSKTKAGRKLYVHSHQPVVDMLLEALQFQLYKETVPVNAAVEKKGNWWTYEIMS